MQPTLMLIDAALKSVVLLAIALGLTVVLRRATAVTRQALWATALAGCVLVPVLSIWIPSWTVGSLPRPLLAGSLVESETSFPETSSTDSLPLALSVPRLTSSAPPSATTERHDEASTSRALVGWLSSRSLPFWIGAVWCCGLLVVLAWQLVGLWRVHYLTRTARSVSNEWSRDLSAARRRAGNTRDVELLTSSQILSPMTWGLLRPTILLPAGSCAWARERRSIVLLHELVHIRRADWLTRVLARTACAVYWFNPLAWLAARRLTVEQEMACDEEVLALGTRPSTYAEHLLHIARSLTRTSLPAPAAVDMAWRSQMEGRLMRILDRNRPKQIGRAVVIPAIVFLFALMPALAAMRAWEASPDPRAPQAPPTASTAVAATANLERLLAQMAELEGQLEPLEAELEILEERLEPIEEELERVEREMEPVEAGLESFEARLEPYEARLEEIEEQLEPGEEELEEIEREMEPLEQRLEDMESELEPYEDRLEEIEREMEPLEDQLDSLDRELEPLGEELEMLSEKLEREVDDDGADRATMDELHSQMNRIHEEMQPIHHRMQAVHEQMRPLHQRMQVVHQEMQPVHERMSTMHDEMRPFHQRMQTVHERLRPIFETLRGVHEEMRPVHEEMSGVHRAMEPYHQRMREHHDRMQPVHHEMQQVHERMRPIHEEMMGVHEDLRTELATLVTGILESELADVLNPGAPFATVATEVLDAVSVHLDDGRLRFRSSSSELRDLLSESLSPYRRTEEAPFTEAVTRAARSIADFELAGP